MTKDSDAARGPWELFVRHGFRWKLLHDPKLESSRNRAECGLDILEELDEDEFAADVPRYPKSVALVAWGACLASSHDPISCTLVLDFGSLHQKPLVLNIVMHRDASVLPLCFLMHQNSWLTSWRFSHMAYFLMLAFLTLAA